MSKYVLTPEDRARGVAVRSEGREARKMRRSAELMLLNKLYAELAMPEWYPER